jgi:hypothetical protein
MWTDILNISSPEYWSVLSLSTPVFVKPVIKLGSQVQVKHDPEQNTFWNLELSQVS